MLKCYFPLKHIERQYKMEFLLSKSTIFLKSLLNMPQRRDKKIEEKMKVTRIRDLFAAYVLKTCANMDLGFGKEL